MYTERIQESEKRGKDLLVGSVRWARHGYRMSSLWDLARLRRVHACGYIYMYVCIYLYMKAHSHICIGVYECVSM